VKSITSKLARIDRTSIFLNLSSVLALDKLSFWRGTWVQSAKSPHSSWLDFFAWYCFVSEFDWHFKNWRTVFPFPCPNRNPSAATFAKIKYSYFFFALLLSSSTPAVSSFILSIFSSSISSSRRVCTSPSWVPPYTGWCFYR
jgi:hypothetical protein